MKRAMKIALAAAMVAVALGAVTGCTRVRLAEDPKTRTFTENNDISLQGATTLKADVTQGVGELKVRSSSTTTDSVGTVFTFAPESWRPEASSTVEGSAAVLTIKQPRESGRADLFTNTRNSWTITLPQGVATDLKLILGVGTSDVDLRGLDLKALDVLTGVGSTTIDLSGARETDVQAQIEAGVGELTLRLPQDVGVRVTSEQDGIGDLSAPGFHHSGTEWTNSAYSGTGPKIEIALTRGIGDIKLVMVN
jgi:hypothetical protein